MSQATASPILPRAGAREERSPASPAVPPSTCRARGGAVPNGPVNLDAIRLDVVRPDDHVVLSLRFVGVTAVTDAKGPRLDRTDGALIIVELPPQAFAEEAFTDDDDG